MRIAFATFTWMTFLGFSCEILQNLAISSMVPLVELQASLEKQILSPSRVSNFLKMAGITVNYGPGEFADLERCSVSLELRQGKVFVLGEGNFTFSVAFAAWRGSWENIEASTLGQEVPNPRTTVLNTIDSAPQGDVEYEYVIPKRSYSFRGGVDATMLNNVEGIDDAHVFFQCPYTPHQPRSYGEVYDNIIEPFFRSASQVQKAGKMIFLGIVNRYAYAGPAYEIRTLMGVKEVQEGAKMSKILGSGDSTSLYHGLGYEFLGADDRFVINEMIPRGYRHMSRNGNLVSPEHVTLCFRKKDDIAERLGELTIGAGSATAVNPVRQHRPTITDDWTEV